MEKNIWEYVMNNKGEVIEKVADYIGVKSFAKTIEGLYRECLENFDDAEDMEEYIADLYGKNISTMLRKPLILLTCQKKLLQVLLLQYKTLNNI